MVKIVEKVPFCIADRNMYPGELLTGIFGFNSFSLMLFHHFVQLAVTTIMVCPDGGFRIKMILCNGLNCISREIGHSFHFKIATRKGRPTLFALFSPSGFRHDQHRGLLFTTSPSLKSLFSVHKLFGVNRRKVPFVHFRDPGKKVLFIPFSHGCSDLLHHIPNGFIPVVAELSLNLFRRKALLGRSHQMNHDEPGAKGQIGILHNRPAPEGRFRFTLLAFKLFHRFQPIMLGMPAIPTLNAFFKASHFKRVPACLLVRELFAKLDKLHIQYFESKLRSMNVTYLRFGT
jgi:hypothetical protein